MNKIVISGLSAVKKLAIHIGVVAAVAALGAAGVELSNVINTLPSLPLVYAVAISAGIGDVVRVLTVELRGFDPQTDPPGAPMA